jgi:hypothetical protein
VDEKLWLHNKEEISKSSKYNRTWWLVLEMLEMLKEELEEVRKNEG